MFPCLMYHEIIAGGPIGKFGVRMGDFIAQMDYLYKEGYRTIDLASDSDICDRKTVLVTFDDGHASNYQAAKVMKERNQTGVFYVLQEETLNNADFLTEENIKEIADMGHIIGVHGKNHDWWTCKDLDLLVTEISDVSRWIESITGRQVITCSAPGGKVNGRIAQMILRRVDGMRYVRNSVPWWNKNLPDSGIINATAVLNSTSIEDFAKVVGLDMSSYCRQMMWYSVKGVAKSILKR